MTSLGADKIFFYEANIHEGIKKVIYLKPTREAYCAHIFYRRILLTEKWDWRFNTFPNSREGLRNKSNPRETKGKHPKLSFKVYWRLKKAIFLKILVCGQKCRACTI